MNLLVKSAEKLQQVAVLASDIQQVSVSTIEGLERKINTYLRRWLGIPRSFCSIGLYSSGSKLQLPVTSVLEAYKATKTHQTMMLRNSKDRDMFTDSK
ncbi:hypothetical protein QTP86_010849 [Hemibagrus guttatus]|nr:hypothetical protein QTP86_010849 [Hemibagrus guttatus]